MKYYLPDKQFYALLISFLFMSAPCSLLAQNPFTGDRVPMLKHSGQDQLLNIDLPLGEIGTSTISLGGRDELRD